MKKAVSVLLFSALFFSACASPSREARLPAEQAPAVDQYRCESGEGVTVRYPAVDVAIVQYKGSSHTMALAVSASGARYVGNGLEWWTKGAEATMFRHEADGSSGDIVESCTRTGGD